MATNARGGIAAGVLAAAAVLVVIVASVGGFGGSVTVEVEPDSFEPEDLAGGVLVAGKHETGGLEILGVRLKPRTLLISLGVAPAPECITLTGEGEERLAGDGVCAVHTDIAGPVVGGGITSEGIRWVAVQVEVERGCFDAALIGAPWPVEDPACGAETARTPLHAGRVAS